MQAAPLFKPFHHPKLELSNRIVMAPMTRRHSPDGVPDDRVRDYYRRRAEGGVGLIITEGTTIDHPAASMDAKIPAFHGAALAGWKAVVDAVHDSGGKIAPQLWHVGARRESGQGPYPDYPTASPSGLVKPGQEVGQALSNAEVKQLVAAFSDAAYAAVELGFDAIELHGAHGYLIDDFFWEGSNRREDEYGGSLLARSRFATEIVQSIRAAIGQEFPLILRFSQWKGQDFDARLAQTPEQLAQFLAPLTAAGVDIFHCSTRRFWVPEFEGSSLNLAGWVKKLSGKPAISVGSVSLNQEFITTYGDVAADADTSSIEELIKRMDGEEFDLIAVGRALIANPDWPTIIRDGECAKLKTYSKALLADLN